MKMANYNEIPPSTASIWLNRILQPIILTPLESPRRNRILRQHETPRDEKENPDFKNFTNFKNYSKESRSTGQGKRCCFGIFSSQTNSTKGGKSIRQIRKIQQINTAFDTDEDVEIYLPKKLYDKVNYGRKVPPRILVDPVLPDKSVVIRYYPSMISGDNGEEKIPKRQEIQDKLEKNDRIVEPRTVPLDSSFITSVASSTKKFGRSKATIHSDLSIHRSGTSSSLHENAPVLASPYSDPRKLITAENPLFEPKYYNNIHMRTRILQEYYDQHIKPKERCDKNLATDDSLLESLDDPEATLNSDSEDSGGDIKLPLQLNKNKTKIKNDEERLRILKKQRRHRELQKRSKFIIPHDIDFDFGRIDPYRERTSHSHAQHFLERHQATNVKVNFIGRTRMKLDNALFNLKSSQWPN